MIDNIQFREGHIDDVQLISKLVLCVFNKYVAPGFSPSGRQIFEGFVQPGAILERLEAGKSFNLVATENKQIVGIIEVRDGNHIALLFVDDCYHKAGIAKKLVTLAIERVEHDEITVHSSPYALEIYIKMGFQQLEKEQESDGIRYIPMKKRLSF